MADTELTEKLVDYLGIVVEAVGELRSLGHGALAETWVVRRDDVVLADSSMKAMRVGFVPRVLYASPGYLNQNGVPDKPATPAAHTLIAASGVSPTTAEFQPGHGTSRLCCQLVLSLLGDYSVPWLESQSKIV